MTSTELATTSPVSVPGTWEASWRLAQRIASTPFVPGALRGKPESVLAAVLYGQELNLGPMQSLASIHVIDGRPAAAPELMRALIARAGHRLDFLETSDECVTLSGTRADTGAKATVTWTMKDAQRAKLTGKGAWVTYPRAMLLARCTSEIARMLFADVVAGLSYTPEEAAGIDGAVWEATSEPDTSTAPPLPAEPADIGSMLTDTAANLAVRIATMIAERPGLRSELIALDSGRAGFTADAFRADDSWRRVVEAVLDRWDSPEGDIVDAELFGADA
jgi:hypothetical protein